MSDGARPRLRAHVDLAAGLDVEVWRARHARGEVPDATPYGYHRLADHGVDVTFRTPRTGRALERVARSVRYRTDGAELLEAGADLLAVRRAGADVVLTYDERTSVPAALLGAARLQPPVVAGVGWLTTRDETHPAMARLAAAALPRAGAVFAQCAPMIDLLTSQWGVPRERAHYLAVGIDTDFYAVQPPPERPDVVASAGEDRHRDHDLLVRAVLEVRRRRPGTTLELASGLPVQMPDDLGVRHTERLDGRMRAVYQRSSVVALAMHRSVTGSGLSVILEAMSSGRPVVATANPGLSDYVTHGVTGLLVPPADEAALADAVASLLDDPDRAAEMGAAAARDVRERFTSDQMAAGTAALARGL